MELVYIITHRDIRVRVPGGLVLVYQRQTHINKEASFKLNVLFGKRLQCISTKKRYSHPIDEHDNRERM